MVGHDGGGDAVLGYWREHREQFRQSENQRAVLTNFVLVIAAALSGFIVELHFELRTLPLSVLIVVIGWYGALAAAKYHERADQHRRPGPPDLDDAMGLRPGYDDADNRFARPARGG
jgi:hypothetical protein